jgi:hypothetical protein
MNAGSGVAAFAHAQEPRHFGLQPRGEGGAS